MIKTFLGIVTAAAMVATSGCTVQTRPAAVSGYAVVGASNVPSRIETYPSTVYQGRRAYLVDGRWYYDNDGGWVVFQDEPPELYQYRTNAVYPPAPAGPNAGYGYGYVRPAPPAPAGPINPPAGPVNEAPPAYPPQPPR